MVVFDLPGLSEPKAPYFRLEGSNGHISGATCSSEFVKGFGCRPFTDGATRAGAGVRKPPGKEPARGGQRGCLRRYGDLAAAVRVAVVGSGPGRWRSRLSVSAFDWLRHR